MTVKPPYISLDPLILWTKVEHPVQWGRFFPDAAPLHVEIGFGLGDYLVRQAETHPDRGIIGLEMEWICIRRTLRKIGMTGIRNVKLIRVEARAAFDRLFPEHSITSVDSIFPCPWPKTRHVKNRLFSRDFLKTVNSRLVSGGKARIVTDHRAYFEWILRQSADTGFAATKRKTPPRFATKYERKWLDLGINRFFELVLVKKEHIPVPPKEDIALKTHRIAQFDHRHFSPSGCRGGIVVEFKDHLFDQGRERGMTRCVVLENGFKQDFWIEIQKRGNYWHIHPAKGCGIIPSAGIQRALDLVKRAADQTAGVFR